MIHKCLKCICACYDFLFCLRGCYIFIVLLFLEIAYNFLFRLMQTVTEGVKSTCSPMNISSFLLLLLSACEMKDGFDCKSVVAF